MKAVTEKLCNRCKVVKPASEFHAWNGYIKWLCKPCEREYQKSSQVRNRDRNNSKRKAWGKAHPEIIRKWSLEQYHKNREKYEAYHHQWYLSHREEILAKLKESRMKKKQVVYLDNATQTKTEDNFR